MKKLVLYHGTTERFARIAIRNGLRPRRMSASKGNWPHTVDSNPEMVYLSSTYAPYFAFCALSKQEMDDERTRIALIEIDVSRLDPEKLMPDEDLIAQALSGQLGELGLQSLLARTEHVRDTITSYQKHWRDSLNALGNCGYMGVIPSEAMTRVCYFRRASNPPMWLNAIDPTITPMNFKFGGEKYRALLRWFMGDAVRPEEVFPVHYQMMAMGIPIGGLTLDEMRAEHAKCLADADREVVLLNVKKPIRKAESKTRRTKRA